MNKVEMCITARRWDGPRAVACFTVDDLVWNSLDAKEDFSGFHFGPPVELHVAAEGWTYYWQPDDPPPEDLVSRLWWAIRTWRQIWRERKEQRRQLEEAANRILGVHNALRQKAED